MSKLNEREALTEEKTLHWTAIYAWIQPNLFTGTTASQLLVDLKSAYLYSKIVFYVYSIHIVQELVSEYTLFSGTFQNKS